MPTSSSTRPDPDLVRTSANELLAAFRSAPPPVSKKLIGDAEMEGQMRGLPNIRFQLAHTKAETAEVGACAAVGYMSQGGYAVRIYHKTATGWSWHTFMLNVEMPKAKQQKGRNGSRAALVNQPPVLSWKTLTPEVTRAARTPRRRHPARRS